MAGDFDPRDYNSRHRDHGVKELNNQGHDRDPVHRHRGIEPVSRDPRDVFARDLDLPHGLERESARDRHRSYALNGSETRTLATAGAFRLVSERDLHGYGRDVRHLEKQGLVARVPVNERESAVTLTIRGRDVLEQHRDLASPHPQSFYAGADRPRERTHDVQIYRAYLREAAGLQERDATIVRVQLDRELKRDYQRFLQERTRGGRGHDGRPDRSDDEIRAWANEHDLPYFDDQVHFPDARVEYRDVDGEIHHLDIEVTTEHYRGAHGAAASRSGFSIHANGDGSRSGRLANRGTAEDFV